MTGHRFNFSGVQTRLGAVADAIPALGTGTGGLRQVWATETLPQKELTKQIHPIIPLSIPMAAGAFHVCGPSPTSRRVSGLHFRLRASNRQIPNAEFHCSHLTPPDIPPRHTPVPRWGRNSGTPAHQASAPSWGHILSAPTASQQPCA